VSTKEQAMLSRVQEQKECHNGYELPLDVIASSEGQEPNAITHDWFHTSRNWSALASWIAFQSPCCNTNQ